MKGLVEQGSDWILGGVAEQPPDWVVGELVQQVRKGEQEWAELAAACGQSGGEQGQLERP